MNLKDLDRLSILQRKIVEGKLRGQETRVWEEEVGLLIGKDEADQNHGILFELAAINAAIWQRQDRIRELADPEADAVLAEAGADTSAAEEAGEIAFDLLKLNDQRAALVGEGKL